MSNIDAIRSKALDEMDRTQRGFKAALFTATLFEGLCLIGMLLVADLRNPLHQLILFGVGLIYLPIVLGLIALGAWVNKCTLRVLQRLDEAR
jgi:hypothetical protein